MTNFTTARFKLTAWYVAIVAIITFAFSGIIYNSVTTDLEHGFQMAEFRIQNPNGVFVPPRRIALQVLDEEFEIAKRAFALRLLGINGIIIAASGIAAYILAGKTLEPLQKSLEEQKRFTADAGHELRTPLTALRTEIEVALRDKKLKLNDSKELLKSNLEEVISLQKLSENLMLLNRYSKDHNGMHFNTLNIKEVIEKAVKKVSPMAKEKKIKIKQNISDIEIKGDAQSLEELVTILLDNAIKYSKEKSEVTVSNKKTRNKVAIDVADHGIGISSEDQKHLFDRFYRSETSRNKSKADGYGLGLAIASEITDRHHGSISVKSKINKGSTFAVCLPL